MLQPIQGCHFCAKFPGSACADNPGLDDFNPFRIREKCTLTRHREIFAKVATKRRIFARQTGFG
jgi:hypothetical protein